MCLDNCVILLYNLSEVSMENIDPKIEDEFLARQENQDEINFDDSKKSKIKKTIFQKLFSNLYDEDDEEEHQSLLK